MSALEQKGKDGQYCNLNSFLYSRAGLFYTLAVSLVKECYFMSAHADKRAFLSKVETQV